jgi:hypothetical protein
MQALLIISRLKTRQPFLFGPTGLACPSFLTYEDVHQLPWVNHRQIFFSKRKTTASTLRSTSPGADWTTRFSATHRAAPNELQRHFDIRAMDQHLRPHVLRSRQTGNQDLVDVTAHRQMALVGTHDNRAG